MNEYSLASIFVKIIRDKWELLLRKWLFLQNVFLLVDALGKKECAGGILLTAKDYLPKRFGQAGEVEQVGQAGEVEQAEQAEQVEQAEQAEQAEQVEQIEQIEQVEQIEQIGQIEQIEQICLTNT